VDAVAVPAARRPENLLEAARISRVAGRLMIVLCSHECRPSEVREQLSGLEPRVPVLIVDMARYEFPERWQTLQQARKYRWPSDTALKRNAALLLARRLGLKHILFLDDDVRGVNSKQLKQAVAAIEREKFRAAGWSFLDFPDNSAVSHAYRSLSSHPYGAQGCFIGGGGLLVAIDENVPHFPLGIYNEDWLFLFQLLEGRQVAHLGSLRQLPYDPFNQPDLALRQEFGDLIAEGLFTRLAQHHVDRSINVADECVGLAFWQVTVDRRKQFLARLITALQAEISECRRHVPGIRDDVLCKAMESVQAAANALEEIDLRHLCNWARAWQRDQERWRELWKFVGSGSECLEAVEWTPDSVRGRLAEGLGGVGLKGRVEVVWPRIEPESAEVAAAIPTDEGVAWSASRSRSAKRVRPSAPEGQMS
jgi:hypothetical protein